MARPKVTCVHCQSDTLVLVLHCHHRKHCSNEAEVYDEPYNMDSTASKRPQCYGSTGRATKVGKLNKSSRLGRKPLITLAQAFGGRLSGKRPVRLGLTK